MAHPRFSRLAPERQQAILDVAAEEFAEHGFDGASYNRIIERAGISKGSAYYYFEGKDDLYATVLETTLTGLVDRVGTWTRPGDAADFWRQLRHAYFGMLDFVMSDERSARLIRGMAQARANPKLQEVWLRFEAPLSTWLGRVLADGRRVGAVRRDVPEDLLLVALTGMAQATDFWLLERWERQGANASRRSAEQVFALIQDLATERPTGKAPRAKKS
ncbi:TetR/AcrR family transcriptional regulator [Pyxidicoccus fallax]|uniref:TetR/AcrR family transcriptional regulator n=1 Tax=Pyxidicoccus fallax TaxID=394095 RepID=A0A848LEZ0_9BACT|nr:TetR/AcrR family transcriptional regulator [Pyxidicoccus fallax]NMO14841.1 TetR/AcrR family transcriptional regulator [Pyxidicoccus fallax]NPC76768.1 TetR/AcrR family transcriptional regulator [Pyxidicoccus fallax]